LERRLLRHIGCVSKVLADSASGHLLFCCDAYFASSFLLNKIASQHIQYQVDEHMGDDDV